LEVFVAVNNDQFKGFFQSAIILNSLFAGGFGIIVAAIDPISSLFKTAMPNQTKTIDDIAAIVRIIGVSGVVGGSNGAISNRLNGHLAPTWWIWLQSAI
jgi:hypothetical protein